MPGESLSGSVRHRTTLVFAKLRSVWKLRIQNRTFEKSEISMPALALDTRRLTLASEGKDAARHPDQTGQSNRSACMLTARIRFIWAESERAGHVFESSVTDLMRSAV
jgi:hypothetical protein